MTSKIKYQKDYTEFNETYQLVLPLSLEGLVPNDDSVRLLSHELEELDYTLLYKAYSSKGRNPAVDPKIMIIRPEKSNSPVKGTSTSCGCLQVRKHQITAQSPVSGKDSCQRLVKICFTKWYVA